MKPRDVPVTRADVQAWLDQYQGQKKPTKKMRDHLITKLQALGLDTVDVDTHDHQDLKDTTPLVDMILMDLDSYA